MESNKFYSKKLLKSFYHFEERLMFRFKIKIDFYQYFDLCKRTDFKTLKIKEDNSRLIIIDYNGFKLKCIKQSEEKGFLLKTVFQPNKEDLINL